MSINMTSTSAALRTAGEPSIALPSGAAAFWQLGTSHSVLGGHDVFGYARAAKRPVDPAPKMRDAVATAKQDRPPRGVPR